MTLKLCWFQLAALHGLHCTNERWSIEVGPAEHSVQSAQLPTGTAAWPAAKGGECLLLSTVPKPATWAARKGGETFSMLIQAGKSPTAQINYTSAFVDQLLAESTDVFELQ
jgi:hypothetical protein